MRDMDNDTARQHEMRCGDGENNRTKRVTNERVLSGKSKRKKEFI